MNNTISSDLGDQWLSSLADSGYRLTQPLHVIVNVLVSTERALSPVDIFDLGRKEYPKMGLVTVYRALEKFEELGLVQRVHHPDGCHRYLRAAHGHEHLLLCTSCGRAVYFAGDDLTHFIHSVAAQTGFEVREHWFQLFGLCEQCRGQ